MSKGGRGGLMSKVWRRGDNLKGGRGGRGII